MSKYIKKNTPSGSMINLWSRTPVNDLFKGPYFCAKCDNEIISSWESFFSKNVWKDPLSANDQWGKPESLNFILSLAYRYAIHFLNTSPISTSGPYSQYIKQITEQAIKDNREIGTKIFIYPYVYKEILNDCKLLPGINHLLSLAVHGQSFPKEGNLPNAFFVMVPKMIFMFTDQDLASINEPSLNKPIFLRPGCIFNATSSNRDMPDFFASFLNGLINHGQSHQKNIGQWGKFMHHADELISPTKMCYQARNRDQILKNWQKINCL